MPSKLTRPPQALPRFRTSVFTPTRTENLPSSNVCAEQLVRAILIYTMTNRSFAVWNKDLARLRGNLVAQLENPVAEWRPSTIAATGPQSQPDCR